MVDDATYAFVILQAKEISEDVTEFLIGDPHIDEASPEGICIYTVVINSNTGEQIECNDKKPENSKWKKAGRQIFFSSDKSWMAFSLFGFK